MGIGTVKNVFKTLGFVGGYTMMNYAGKIVKDNMPRRYLIMDAGLFCMSVGYGIATAQLMGTAVDALVKSVQEVIKVEKAPEINQPNPEDLGDGIHFTKEDVLSNDISEGGAD